MYIFRWMKIEGTLQSNTTDYPLPAGCSPSIFWFQLLNIPTEGSWVGVLFCTSQELGSYTKLRVQVSALEAKEQSLCMGDGVGLLFIKHIYMASQLTHGDSGWLTKLTTNYCIYSIKTNKPFQLPNVRMYVCYI